MKNNANDKIDKPNYFSYCKKIEYVENTKNKPKFSYDIKMKTNYY